jgi:hypothetical protein
MSAYTPARGSRGDFKPGRGDLTGARFLANVEAEEAHDRARDAAIAELQEGHHFVYVDVPGRSMPVPVPKDAYQHLEKILGR